VSHDPLHLLTRLSYIISVRHTYNGPLTEANTGVPLIGKPVIDSEDSVHELPDADQSMVERSKFEQSKVEQPAVEHSETEESKIVQSNAEQSRPNGGRSKSSGRVAQQSDAEESVGQSNVEQPRPSSTRLSSSGRVARDRTSQSQAGGVRVELPQAHDKLSQGRAEISRDRVGIPQPQPSKIEQQSTRRTGLDGGKTISAAGRPEAQSAASLQQQEPTTHSDSDPDEPLILNTVITMMRSKSSLRSSGLPPPRKPVNKSLRRTPGGPMRRE
jgi:hypothetical protein